MRGDISDPIQSYSIDEKKRLVKQFYEPKYNITFGPQVPDYAYEALFEDMWKLDKCLRAYEKTLKGKLIEITSLKKVRRVQDGHSSDCTAQ